MQKHHRQIRLRQLVPPAFVVAFGCSALLAPFASRGRMLLAAIIGSYAVANMGASLMAARSKWRLLPYLPLTYATLHIAYGSGYLVGLVHFRKTRSANRSRSA